MLAATKTVAKKKRLRQVAASQPLEVSMARLAEQTWAQHMLRESVGELRYFMAVSATVESALSVWTWDLKLRCNFLLLSASAPSAAQLSTDQVVSRHAMQASGKLVCDSCEYKRVDVA